MNEAERAPGNVDTSLPIKIVGQDEIVQARLAKQLGDLGAEITKSSPASDWLTEAQLSLNNIEARTGDPVPQDLKDVFLNWMASAQKAQLGAEKFLTDELQEAEQGGSSIESGGPIKIDASVVEQIQGLLDAIRSPSGPGISAPVVGGRPVYSPLPDGNGGWTLDPAESPFGGSRADKLEEMQNAFWGAMKGYLWTGPREMAQGVHEGVESFANNPFIFIGNTVRGIGNTMYAGAGVVVDSLRDPDAVRDDLTDYLLHYKETLDSMGPFEGAERGAADVFNTTAPYLVGSWISGALRSFGALSVKFPVPTTVPTANGALQFAFIGSEVLSIGPKSLEALGQAASFLFSTSHGPGGEAAGYSAERILTEELPDSFGRKQYDFTIGEGAGRFEARLYPDGTLDIGWQGGVGNLKPRLNQVASEVQRLGEKVTKVTGQASANLEAIIKVEVPGKVFDPDRWSSGLSESFGGNWNTILEKRGSTWYITSTRIPGT